MKNKQIDDLEKTLDEQNKQPILAQQILTIYKAYPVQACRGYAIAAIAAALRQIAREGNPNPYKYLLFRVQQFAKSDIAQSRSYVPYCHNWMEAQRWADDDSVWSVE